MKKDLSRQPELPQSVTAHLKCWPKVKLLLVAFAVAVLFGALMKGVWWSEDLPVFEPGPQLTMLVRDADKHVVRPDGVEVIGSLVVPGYLHWLTKNTSRHGVSVKQRR
jgi:hypothetical protein